jgi:hypothetical protein
MTGSKKENADTASTQYSTFERGGLATKNGKGWCEHCLKIMLGCIVGNEYSAEDEAYSIGYQGPSAIPRPTVKLIPSARTGDSRFAKSATNTDLRSQLHQPRLNPPIRSHPGFPLENTPRDSDTCSTSSTPCGNNSTSSIGLPDSPHSPR